MRVHAAGDLALHPRRDQNRAQLGQRLHAGGDVGDIAVNLACRIEHRRPRFQPGAGGEDRLAGAFILAVPQRGSPSRVVVCQLVT